MRLAKFQKSPGDRKRYTIDYSEWLDEGETLTGLTTANPGSLDGVYVDGALISEEGNNTVIMYVSGGLPGHSYDVGIEVTTSGNQIREDYITFVVSVVPDLL